MAATRPTGTGGGQVVEHVVGTDVCFHEALPEGRVRCLVCSHQCVIPPNATGICCVRKNEGGSLRLVVYGSAKNANGHDPIEKKPLYHVLPGSRTFSVATVGCNFACSFCQNWDLSQCAKELKLQLARENRTEMLDVEVSSMGYHLLPAELVARAQAANVKVMAFTYNEPTIFFEYALDTAAIAKAKGIKCIFKSNGYESALAVSKMVGLIDAVNVDLKSFRDEFYRTLCKARVQPVLDTIARLKRAGIWVEVTTLIIPGENDSDEEVRAIADFIASVDPNIPWHITPFHPDYQMTDKPRTPISTLTRAGDIARAAGLKFVYNRGAGGNTLCSGCHSVLISREGFQASATETFDSNSGVCRSCGAHIPGVWS
ncbi:AmmeMemoRadiSam system radical SAM enzyme [Pelomyxa schiedti]|nr:AmmeMemoRadiSam system radical SAM enzyme [Pelomyxa schiedti]